tara:strand:- start:1512 stop:2402 length:891 start_codon:yes stop_codon:yes gene_type:complete
MTDLKYYTLEPAYFRLDGGAMYGIIPKPLWNKVHQADDQNRVDMSLRLMAIETKSQLIVIDTGIGDYHGDKFDARFDVRGQKDPLTKAVEAIGKKPSDVTDLVISHLHFDHVGGIGIADGGKTLSPVFKNARLHLHRDHWAYAHAPTERDGGSFHTHNFDPVVDYYRSNSKIVWHEGNDGEILKYDGGGSLRFKCSFGHTPYLMHPYDDKFIYLADLIPTSNHVHIPWVMGYDIAPGVTTKDKRQFLEFVLEKNLTIIYEHDPKFWGSKVVRDGKGGFDPDQKFETKQLTNFQLDL